MVVVPSGTTVTWQNTGHAPHSLIGQVSSPGDFQPGSTYQRRFTTPGEYNYRDGHHPDHAGTVVVLAGSKRPKHPNGRATYHYRARLKLSVDDQWTYFDPQWGTTTGPCNAQVGSGERLIDLDAHFANVTYERVPSVGVEILSSRNNRARFDKYSESIDSKIADDNSELVRCPDGSMEPTADQPADCHHDFDGKRLVLNLNWGPKSTKNRFEWNNLDGPSIPPGSCGSQIVGALALVGVKGSVLPLNLGGFRVDYDEGETGPATTHEVNAIRAGRAFTVSRHVNLDFTTPCCEGFNPGSGGVFARIANIHHYTARLTIHFTPVG